MVFFVGIVGDDGNFPFRGEVDLVAVPPLLPPFDLSIHTCNSFIFVSLCLLSQALTNISSNNFSNPGEYVNWVCFTIRCNVGS